MEDQRDRRARAGARMEAAFEAAFWARENHFGHVWFGARVSLGGPPTGAPRQRVLYRSACSCGNRQESTAFERARPTLSRPCGDDACAAPGPCSPGARAGLLGKPQLAARGGPRI